MLLRECVWMVATGMAAGLPLALLSGRLIQAQLYGLRPADPATTALATLTLLAVSLATAILPAWRATRVDPVNSLRYE